VRIGTFNRHQWTDVPSETTDAGLTLQVKVTPDPMIIRLVRVKPAE
jgi:hypothetical protein